MHRLTFRFKRRADAIRLLALTVTALVLTACAVPVPQPVDHAPPNAPKSNVLPGLVSSTGYPSLAPLMRQVTPAVVNIAVEATSSGAPNGFRNDPEFRRFLDRFGLPMPEANAPEQHRSLGSGVIINAARGYVMTNEHLLKDATKIMVTLKDRRSFRAQRIGSDEATDLAILKIPPVSIQALPLGNSERLEVGDFVVAIGNPFGLGQTVTLGIVSAVGRSSISGNRLGELIQTDASINPGNSGGPLLNLAGEVVGINTALIGPTGGNVGIGFAMPSNRARQALNKVIGVR